MTKRGWNARQTTKCVPRRRQQTEKAAERNSIYRHKDVTRDRETVRKREREIKRGASGCQVDQNKHWVPCRQRARFSQTDTKLDPPLSSSKQQNTDIRCEPPPVFVWTEWFISLSFSFFLLWSLISNFPSLLWFPLAIHPLFAPFFQLLPTFLPCFYSFYHVNAPSLRPSLHPSCPLIVLPSSPHLSHS